MPDGDSPVILKLVSDLTAVPAAEWDACAGRDNPFLGHAFLTALEESGSATGETGWQPQHLILEDERTGRLLGAVPMYLKGHSFGEYVFDHGWADAYERAGGRYYPKLQACVPFTPVAGPRLLVRPDADSGPAADLLVDGLRQVCDRMGVSSVHVTFATEPEWTRFGEAGWLLRTGEQFHWENRGYGSFDDFLDTLASRKRKAIRRERRAVAEAGVSLRVLTGDDLKPRHWDAFFDFYQNTSDRKWGFPYLTRAFFDLIGERMPDRIALVMAEQDGRPIAGALNLIGAETLYGRNWGCVVDVPFLHFEACYHQAIEFAIERGLKRVEAGAQGQHKIQRGYLPVRTYSAHWIRDPALRGPVAQFLERERRQVDWEIEALSADSPYRRTEDNCP